MKKILYFVILIVTSIGFSQNLSMQNGVFIRCAPDKFYDSGGEFGNYADNESFTTTICPENGDEFIILNFTVFNTQLNQDILTIYDGDDTSASVLGVFSGVASPGNISATTSNTSGCLTITFSSSTSVNMMGWEAEILCIAECQDIEASIDSTSPALNASGVISILPGESVNFSGSATFAIDGTNAIYEWDFSDTNTAVGTDVANTFINAGLYTVTLTVSDDDPQGCTGTATITVLVIGPNVVVDQNTFTIEQLIEDVLVNSPCASVSNIIASTGSNFSPTEPNGIGYFFSNGIDFPFEDGLLLTSGNARRAGGPNVFLGDGTVEVWPGDIDLDFATGINSQNATFIQFDFTPLADTISFDFLMASEEYDMGDFECAFSDAFAFLLTDSMGNTTNLAVLPGTNTPILVTNIHPDNGAACGGANEQYFGEYTPNNAPPISFDGRTAVFTAESAVISGENYTIKLVIADDNDANYDSGVFLKAGSFDLGGDLGEDITIASGTAECGGNSVTLDTGISTADHKWYFEGVEIPDETDSTLILDETGTYSVDVVYTGGCQTTDSVFVEFRTSPTANQAQDIVGCSGTGVAEFNLSENDDDVLGGQNAADFAVTYHLTEQDAIDNVGALPVNYTNVSNPQLIWARMADSTQTCFDTTSFTISATNQPTINPVIDLELCDDGSNDGIEEFDLSVQTLVILGSQPDTDFNVTYHLSFADSNSGIGALPSLYSNVNNTEPIFVRVERVGDRNCYNASSAALFDLVVNVRAIGETVDNLVVCDDLSNDGIATFDLRTQESALLGIQDPALFNVSFHASQGDADTKIGVLPTSYTNTTPNLEPIYVRVEDPAHPDCYGTTSFNLVVSALPTIVAVTPLLACDDADNDGFTAFSLSTKEGEILNGQTGVEVSFHDTLLGADSGTAELFDGYINTTMTNQTVFVRLENSTTNCYNVNSLQLEVIESPIANAATDLELCDDMNTGDGLEVFDLTANEILILNGESGVTASYHESSEDGDLGQNAILDPTNYTNTQSPEQEIYVRVTKNITGCYVLVNFKIIVQPLPDVIAVTDIIQCELNTDGFASFDLTSKDADVLNGQDPTQFVVSYHENVLDAETEMNALVSPYINLSNPQQIFVTITNNQTGCSISTKSFNIAVDEVAEANPDMVPILYEQCNDAMETDGDPSNDRVPFDLATRDPEVLDGQDPTNYIVSYYATGDDANLNVSPLPNLYENLTNPQVIYARVDNNRPDIITGNDTSICFAVASLTLQVNPLPEFDLDDSYILCVNTNGTEIVNIPVLDTGLSNTAYSFEWSYNGTVLASETSSSLLATQGGTYSVIVTDTSSSTVTSCSSMDTAEVIESEPPMLVAELVTQLFGNSNDIEAVATGIGDYEYNLDGGPWQDSGVFTDVSSGLRVITARDKLGCGIASVEVLVIDYPLYFTPNGDNNHDTWNIAGIESSAIIYIFDRYGKLIKQLSPRGSGWDGTFNGNMLPTSDYWFTVIYNEPLTGNPKEFKAHFTLKR